MKTQGFIIVIILIIAVFCAACTTGGTGSQTDGTAVLPAENTAENNPANTSEGAVTENKEPSSVSREPGEFEMAAREIPSPSLSNSWIDKLTTRNINIFLPPSYHQEKKDYPVIYFLAGYADDISIWYDSTVLSILNSFYRDHQNKEMIFVAVDGRNDLDGGFYVNSPVSGNWEDYVVKDVVGYIDSNYRTAKSRDARGLAGHSMGGFGCLSIAMHNSELFSSIYSMSPGLFDKSGLSKALKDWEMEVNIYDAYGAAFCPLPDLGSPFTKYPVTVNNGKEVRDNNIWEIWDNGFGGLENKVNLYKNNLQKLKALTIDYGENDPYTWIPDGCKYFSELLNKEGISHQLLSYPGDHATQVPERLLQNVLPFFAEQLSFK